MRQMPPNPKPLCFRDDGPQPATTFYPSQPNPSNHHLCQPHHLKYLQTQSQTCQTRHVGWHRLRCQAFPEPSTQLPQFVLRHGILKAGHVHTQPHDLCQVAILD